MFVPLDAANDNPGYIIPCGVGKYRSNPLLVQLRRAQKVEAAAGVERKVRQARRVNHDVVGIPERDGGKICGEDLLNL